MKITCLLFLPLLFFFLPARAQNKYFERATIVKNNGDTTIGYVERLRDNLLAEGITFKKDLANAERQQFSPADLLSFTLPGENIQYEPVTYEYGKDGERVTEKRFAILVLKGYCSLYLLELKDDELNIIFARDNSHVFLVKKDGVFTILKESEAIVDNIYKLDKDYIARMKTLFNDCPSIDAAMIENTEFYKKDLVQIFTAYDLCKKPGIKPETYKAINKLKINIGVYLGYPIFGMKDVSNSFGISEGFSIDIKNPRANERLAFSTGLNFTQLKSKGFPSNYDGTEDVRVNMTGISLKGTYYLSKGKVAPFLSFGVVPTFIRVDSISISGLYTNDEKDWLVLSSFGPGILFKKLYTVFLVEKEAIISFGRGTFYNFRVGFVF